jgi:hypothetical protein
VRGIGCADCLRDLRDSAQSHVPYIAQRMMTTAMSCRLEVGEWGVSPATGQAGGGVLVSGSHSYVIRLEDVVVDGVYCEPLCTTVTWLVYKITC